MSKNTFGGGNAHSLYVPMSDIEQEALDRLVDKKELVVYILNWGYVDNPKIEFGDKRVKIQFKLNFAAPEVPIKNYFFDLELRTRSGIVLFKERQATMYGGQPISIVAGLELGMVWDISIEMMNPAFIKTVLPQAVGLTSRVGNMQLDPDQQKLFEEIQEGNRKGKEITRALAQKATDEAQG
jgi:hypothetical protein